MSTTEPNRVTFGIILQPRVLQQDCAICGVPIEVMPSEDPETDPGDQPWPRLVVIEKRQRVCNGCGWQHARMLADLMGLASPPLEWKHPARGGVDLSVPF